MPKGVYIRTDACKWTDERRAKLSSRMLGNKCSLGYKHSNETKLKKSLALLGGKSPLYKDGRSPLTQAIRFSWKSKEWKKRILELDNYTCVKCNKKGCQFEIHHYIQFKDIFESFIKKYNNLSVVNDKDKLYKLSFNYNDFWNECNGFTLCLECHNKTKGGEDLWTC